MENVPFSPLTFYSTVKHNTLKCIIQNMSKIPEKNQYRKFLHINRLLYAIFLQKCIGVYLKITQWTYSTIYAYDSQSDTIGHMKSQHDLAQIHTTCTHPVINSSSLNIVPTQILPMRFWTQQWFITVMQLLQLLKKG